MLRKRAVLTKATAVFSMNFKHFVTLTPEQLHASDVIHLRDERKVHTTAKYKNWTLQWRRVDLSEARPSAIPGLGGLCWRGSPGSPWLRVSSGASVNLIKKGIVKSSSNSGCEIMLLNPNNFYSNQLSCHEELWSKAGGKRTSWHTFVNPKSCCRQKWKTSCWKNNYVSI